MSLSLTGGLVNIERIPGDDWLAVVVFEYQDISYLGAALDDGSVCPSFFFFLLSFFFFLFSFFFFLFFFSSLFFFLLVCHKYTELLTLTNSLLQRKYLCDDSAAAANLCSKDNVGTFIVKSDVNSTSYANVITKKIVLRLPQTLSYPIEKTGYYCVSLYSDNENYEGHVTFQNAYGYLPAPVIPKLPFFGAMAIAYIIFLAIWMYAYMKNRQDILPVQNYITAVAALLIVEMTAIWAYYLVANLAGDKWFVKVFLVSLSVLNALRNAFSFFLVLIVCLGYGVVRTSLGKTMLKCKILAGVHFLGAVAFSVASYITIPDELDILLMFLVLPLCITTMVFYIWTMTALSHTIQQLVIKKQEVKAKMYKNLTKVLMFSLIVLFVFFFVDSIIVTRMSDTEYIESQWKSRWFLLDGWLNIIYFLDFCAIGWIWRPTRDNRRFAMSNQLAQSEEDYVADFDMDDLQSIDENDVGHRQSPDGYGQFPSSKAQDSDDDNDSIDFALGEGSANHTTSTTTNSPPPSYSVNPEIAVRDLGAEKKVSANTITSQHAATSAQSTTVFAVGEDDELDPWSDDDYEGNKTQALGKKAL